MEVITRQGSPHFLKDLDKVSAGFAKTIIVLNPDGPRDHTANMVRPQPTGQWHLYCQIRPIS